MMKNTLFIIFVVSLLATGVFFIIDPKINWGWGDDKEDTPSLPETNATQKTKVPIFSTGEIIVLNRGEELKIQLSSKDMRTKTVSCPVSKWGTRESSGDLRVNFLDGALPIQINTLRQFLDSKISLDPNDPERILFYIDGVGETTVYVID